MVAPDGHPKVVGMTVMQIGDTRDFRTRQEEAVDDSAVGTGPEHAFDINEALVVIPGRQPLGFRWDDHEVLGRMPVLQFSRPSFGDAT
jgi:hypothetical protein